MRGAQNCDGGEENDDGDNGCWLLDEACQERGAAMKPNELTGWMAAQAQPRLTRLTMLTRLANELIGVRTQFDDSLRCIY
jgi:hypothetical protein